MHKQQFVGTLVAVTGMALATACDNAETLAAPRAASTPTRNVVPAIGPGPLLSALAANLCADVWQESRTPGAPVVVYGCHGGANQQFVLRASGEIAAYGGALCLDVYQARANDGDPVVVFPCNGGANQKWTRTAAGELRTAVNGKCLDLWGGAAANGAKLAVYTCHGRANQKWTVNDESGAQPQQPQPVDPVNVPGSAELPRATVDTRMPAVTGKTINVAAGGDLQAALDAAQPGDQVVLQAGATFVGNFVLRAKANMGAGQWITVRGGGSLPAEGTRVGPADAGQMPKLLTGNWAPALSTAPSAQGWRVTGLEIAATSSLAWTYSLVNLGGAGAEQSTASQIPGRLVLDRTYIHGSSTLDVRRCVTLNSANTGIVDSYLADCHSRMNESQAILGWNGPGPFKIENNYLAGGHEVIMFGGGDPNVPGLVPSDITVRRNHVTRPAAWKGVWQVKNLMELKVGQRLLVEGNVFENNWLDAQNGFAFVWWSLNAEGGAPWSVTQDITFRSNVVRNTPQVFNLHVGNNPALPLRRITIANNVITGPEAAYGRLVQVMGAVGGLTIAKNTALGGASDVYFGSPDQQMPTFVFTDNVTAGQYSLFGDGGSMGSTTLTRMGIPAASVRGNVFASDAPHVLPQGNAYAASLAQIGFVNLGAGDLTLSAGSPFLSSGTGGTRPGADVASVTQLTQGVVR